MTQQTNIADLSDDELIEYACTALEQRLSYRLSTEGATFTSPDECKRFLVLKLAEREQEVFIVLFLDSQHRLIKYEEMFFGTVDGASVHPRVIAQAALKYNAAAVILAHNHPSGSSNPSAADKMITRLVKEALRLIDVRVLDHIVIGGTDTVSLAEKRMI